MPEPHVKLYGAHWCPDCRNTKQFLGELRVPYEWVDVDVEPGANEHIARINNGKRVIPTLEVDGEALVNPSNAALAAHLGLQSTAKESFYDLIVVGSGPAGLTAALYAAREGLAVLVIEKGTVGGQASITDKLDNFPGFPDGISGAEFAQRLTRQAERFGVELLRAQEVTDVRADDDAPRLVRCADGSEYGARAVLIATGSTYRRLNVPGEDELIGAGIHFCATCDGPFYKGQEVAVIGGGNSAAEESLFLTRFAEKVTVLVRGEALTASSFVAEKVLAHPAIDVRLATRVVSFEGNGALTGITVRAAGGDGEETLSPAAAFVFIGLSPNTKWLSDEFTRDDHGFMVTGPTLETSRPGVFAAGDLRQGSTKQAASAAGEGATAALMIREYLNRH